MDSEIVSTAASVTRQLDLHSQEEHIHKSTFLNTYVFSQDHKMIAKQFLITGIAWAIMGALFSVLFRLQLGFPEKTFPILEDILGKWAKGGQIQPEFYYALITMHGYLAGQYGPVYNLFPSGLAELYLYYPEYANQGDVHDQIAAHRMGPPVYCHIKRSFLSCTVKLFYPVIIRQTCGYQLLLIRHFYCRHSKGFAQRRRECHPLSAFILVSGTS